MSREGLKPKPLHGALKPFWRVKKGVMARYDMMASSYDVRYGEEQSKKHEVAMQTLGSFCGKMVLDEGCGTGLLLSKIAGYNTSIVGVDLSRRMLKRAV